MPDLSTIWKRRVALMALVGLLVAIPATIAIRDDDGDSDQLAVPETPEAGELEFDRDVGIELRLPKGWKRGREGDAVTFRSRDGDVLIAIAIPGPVDDADAIHEAAIDTIKSQYDSVEVGRTVKRQKLGGRPAQTVPILARNPKTGEPVRIFVSTAKGEDFAYLAEVFAAGENPGESLVEAQVLLNNMRLRG